MSDNRGDDTSSTGDDHLCRLFEELDMGVSQFFADDVKLNKFDSEINVDELDNSDGHFAQLKEHDVEKRYKVLSKIDSGGMKEIWSAEDLHTLRSIAIAVLKDNKIIDKEKKELFVREAQLTANLQHPNIVPIYDVSVDSSGAPYFTMKELKGKTLEEIVSESMETGGSGAELFSRNDFISIFQKICDAVAYAHSRGIVHLDLKPSNILICDYGEVLVIDWGISQFISDVAVEQDHSLADQLNGDEPYSSQTLMKVVEITNKCSTAESTNDMLAGSPGYMAPEQISGDATGLDHRTDIYLLGGILYFILSGCSPIEGKKLEEVIDNTLSSTIKSLDTKNVSSGLRAITMKALSLQKDCRYASVEEMQQDLRKYIDGFATHAESTSFFKTLSLLVRRHKVLAAVISICFLVVTVIISISMVAINNQRTVALKHLDELQEKSTYIATLTKEVAPMCLSDAEKHYKDNEFDLFRKSLAAAMTFDPTLSIGNHYQLQIYIAEQKFNQAREFINNNPEPPRISWSGYSAFNFWASKKDDSEKLRDHEFVSSYFELIGRYSVPHFLRFAIHEMNSAPFKAKEHFELIEKLLLEYNPGIKKLNFAYKYTDIGLEIDLSNNPELKTAVPLAGLNIAVLRINNTGVETIDFITKWGLKELYCANSPIRTIIGRALLNTCRKIDFRGTVYSDTNYLYTLEHLEYLDLRNRSIRALPKARRERPLQLHIEEYHRQTIDMKKLKELKYDVIVNKPGTAHQ